LIPKFSFLIKFWLNIDKDEQLRRFQRRESIPEKKWKITDEDYRNREKWDLYKEALNEIIKNHQGYFQISGNLLYLLLSNSKCDIEFGKRKIGSIALDIKKPYINSIIERIAADRSANPEIRAFAYNALSKKEVNTSNNI